MQPNACVMHPTDRINHSNDYLDRGERADGGRDWEEMVNIVAVTLLRGYYDNAERIFQRTCARIHIHAATHACTRSQYDESCANGRRKTGTSSRVSCAVDDDDNDDSFPRDCLHSRPFLFFFISPTPRRTVARTRDDLSTFEQ